MQTFKQILKPILFPPPLVNLLAALIGFGLVLSVPIFKIGNPVYRYIAYVSSAYALIVTVTGFPRLIRLFRSIRRRIGRHRLAVRFKKSRFGSRYLYDVYFRTRVSLYLGLTANLLYIAMKMVSGFYYRSVWFTALAFYYLVLAILRYILLGRGGRRKAACPPLMWEWRRYRLCGILLLLMNQALTVIVIIIVQQNQGFNYPGVLIYAMAAYSFYLVISAAVRIGKYRRHGSPILSAAKAVSFVAALVSMLSLTTAMLTQFGDGDTDKFRRIMTASVGGGVCTVVILIAILMIARAQYHLKNSERNKTQTKPEQFTNSEGL